MASGAPKIAYGSFKGTGADIDIKGQIGFRPRSVRIINEDGPDEGEWIEGMEDASIFKRVAAGTLTLVAGSTTNGITPLADGFKLGADTDLNVSGQLVRFIATE
ncbi:hypothetical protein LCGC14_0334600 [marine sediment metagenome]|uniref:Uncharacterized protein n=1 Tax=marine sediment metagenome TaxID=412755 RepID=A0A0F9TYB1_9ZZZZ